MELKTLHCSEVRSSASSILARRQTAVLVSSSKQEALSFGYNLQYTVVSDVGMYMYGHQWELFMYAFRAFTALKVIVDHKDILQAQSLYFSQKGCIMCHN